MSPRGWIVTTFAMAGCLLPAACGGDESADGAAPEGRGVDVVFGDCSKSFRSRAGRYVDDMVEVALSSATHDRWLYAGCVDGSPLRTLEWAVKVDFASFRLNVNGDEDLAEQLKRAHALGTRRKLTEMVETPPRAPRSGQLEALELASQIDNLRRVWLFSDAIVRQLDEVDLDKASNAEIDQAARTWAHRLGGGLTGVTVTFVGGGQGAPSTAAARRAKRLFDGVVKGGGGDPIWSQTSAFPEGDA